MKKSTKIRKIVFEILIEIYKKNKNFDDLLNKNILLYSLNTQEKNFVYNICINTMRYNIHCDKILNKFIKKKLKVPQLILLRCAVTQIVFLNIKSYAVVNETVEISKSIGLYPSFINAILNKIVKDCDIWLNKELKYIKEIKLSVFLNTYFLEPNLHIVFKSPTKTKRFREIHELSSDRSAFIKFLKKIDELDKFKDGYWWVQNFSSMLPIMLSPNLKNKSILDLCAAPGGKAFQLISRGYNVTLNDVNKKRIKVLKENLIRLNFSNKIQNFDALKFPETKKYDVVFIDAPCSSIGTVRKNPDIMFKTKIPDLNKLAHLQYQLLLKSAKLINNNGVIIYMVCSFLYRETLMPIKKFLKHNNNFEILKYELPKDLKIKSFINKEGFFLTAPNSYKNYLIDGFFSVQLTKHD